MSSSLFGDTKPMEATPNAVEQAKTAMQNVNSPGMRMVMGLMRGKGLSAEQLVRSTCQQNGMDVDAFMNQVKSMRPF